MSIKPVLLNRNPATLRFRLIITIGLILLFCQIISVLWLWHESKEQIQLLVQQALDHRDRSQHVDNEIHEAIASLAIPSLIMIIFTLLLCMQAVKRITRPLSELQRELESRTEEDLGRITSSSSVKEIDAVTQSINQLVTRLTTSLERERLFTADVAHELRTPLAGLRLHLEIIERQHQINVKPLIQRIDQMTSSVAQLLQLARVGQSFSSGNYQRVSLVTDVVRPMESELKMMLSQHQQQLDLEITGDVIVRGDATLLKALLRNLVENAHRYSPENTTITLGVRALPQPVLMVEDQGPGIDENKISELSKAFVRIDRRYGGIGLGLSIVTRIVQLHDAKFFLENRQSAPGCRAYVRFNQSDV